jgi:NIPSNAP
MKKYLIGLIAGLLLGSGFHFIHDAQAATASRVFEIRTYTAHPGKLDALNARFRDHTMKFFDKHGMTSIAYWTPEDAPLSQNTLIYVISHESREAAKKNWDAFRNDADIRKVFAASEEQGKLVAKVEAVYMDATDYSPLK